MRVLIVSKTRAGALICVGGLAADGSNARLTEQEGMPFLPANTEYEIGQVWDLSYTPCNDIAPPHLEDVLVTSSDFLYSRNDLAALLPGLIHAWSGGVDSLFDGKISGPTPSGSGYVQDDVPGQSVGFWMPDRDLQLESEDSSYSYGRRFYYRYEPFRLPYVGAAPPLERIPLGTLVRVSLSRWFKPSGADDDFPERCYLQISGSY